MGGHVLLVDDSGFARRSLRKILEGAGYSVEEAKDGMEALERYAVRKPDVVLLDMVMEGMQGMEVLAKLRELDASAKVVLATADIQASTQTEGKEAGATGMIRKPFQAEQVLQAVEKASVGGAAWS
jgi:two-component system chemotaxis response regulator CheY